MRCKLSRRGKDTLFVLGVLVGVFTGFGLVGAGIVFLNLNLINIEGTFPVYIDYIMIGLSHTIGTIVIVGISYLLMLLIKHTALSMVVCKNKPKKGDSNG